MAAQPDDKSSYIPECLFDPNTRRKYQRMRFFGRGGFAECYEIIDIKTNDVYAGKIVPKKKLVHQKLKDQMKQELEIHSSLNHKNIAKCHGFFEDNFNMYIVLEFCSQLSMKELHERRKTITEFECRYYIKQIIQGVKYLHANRIIHRDIKLGNLFLNDMLHVKIGDFGLATRIEYDGERKMTLCGTPNYMAPEIVTKKGYSFEVDIWSIGCVMYILLVGQPPFKANTLKDTYSKISKCEYFVPNYLLKSATEMVGSMLQSNPDNRATITDLMNLQFLSGSTVPDFLPISCLTMAPSFDTNEPTDAAAVRKPLKEVNVVRNFHDTITVKSE